MQRRYPKRSLTHAHPLTLRHWVLALIASLRHPSVSTETPDDVATEPPSEKKKTLHVKLRKNLKRLLSYIIESNNYYYQKTL